MIEKQKTGSLLGSSLLVAALLSIFVGQRVLGDDDSSLLVTSLGALLLAAAFALRVRALFHTEGDAKAVEGRLLVSYLGVAASLLLHALSTGAGLGLSGEAQERASGVLSALWPAVLLVSISALFFMELVYARMPVAASVELRRVRTAAYAGLTLALCAVFLLSMNYVATARDLRRDLSYFKTTEPSAATLRMLQKLEAPVQIMLFFRRGGDVATQLEPYFAALAGRTDKLRYQIVDAALAPELSHKHRISGNGFVLLLQGEGDDQKGQSIKIGEELTAARAQLKKFDGLFQQHFGKLTRPERTALLTVGHGERSGTEDRAKGEGAQVLEDILRRFHLKTSKLGLAQGLGSAVPDGSSAVIVMGPTEKFLPEEAETLLAHVHKGGRLLLMIDPDADDGLSPLLAGLGVERLPGILMSEKNYMRRNHDASDKAFVFSNSYSSHPVVTTASRYQNEVATIFVRGGALAKAEVTPEIKPSVSFPLRTSASFFRDLDGDFVRDEGEPEGVHNMIAAVSVAEKPGAPEGRAVIIADGDFMTDKVAANNGNMMVFVDALAWLIGNEELPAEVSSEEDVAIAHTRDEDQLWFYLTTFGVPLPIAGLGLWVSRRRRRPEAPA